MTTLDERIQLLNKYSSPNDAAYSDRRANWLSHLADYEFKEEGGGRELVYAKWDNDAIQAMDEDSFSELIKSLEINDHFLKCAIGYFDK